MKKYMASLLRKVAQTLDPVYSYHHLVVNQELPAAPEMKPAAQNSRNEISKLIGDLIKDSEVEYLASETSALLDRAVTKHMLYSYAAVSRISHRIPFDVAIAFGLACRSKKLLEFHAKKHGCFVISGEEGLLAELGRLRDEERKLRELKASVKELLKRRG